MKDVDDDFNVVEHDPLAGGKSVNRRCPNVVVLLQLGFDFVGDCLQLRLRCG
jgi:hypothetical protein